jgi:hypothetical protein
MNAARLGQRFEPRRNVDAVAIEIAAIHHHVPEIDPDAQHNSLILHDFCIGVFHGLLQLDSAFDHIHGGTRPGPHRP